MSADTEDNGSVVFGGDTELPRKGLETSNKAFVESLRVGDWADVVAEGIYCPATVLSISAKIIRVHYLGWEDPTFDENVSDFSRFHAPFSHVHRVKVWAALSDRVAHWPCVVYIRTAVNGAADVEEFLRQEKRIFVSPKGQQLTAVKPFAKGAWVAASSIIAYGQKFTFRKPLPEGFLVGLELAKRELENDTQSRFAAKLKFVGTFEEALAEKERAVRAAIVRRERNDVKFAESKEVEATLYGDSHSASKGPSRRSKSKLWKLGGKRFRGSSLLFERPPKAFKHERTGSVITKCAAAHQDLLFRRREIKLDGGTVGTLSDGILCVR